MQTPVASTDTRGEFYMVVGDKVKGKIVSVLY
jgi:hypothetical protein